MAAGELHLLPEDKGMLAVGSQGYSATRNLMARQSAEAQGLGVKPSVDIQPSHRKDHEGKPQSTAHSPQVGKRYAYIHSIAASTGVFGGRMKSAACWCETFGASCTCIPADSTKSFGQSLPAFLQPKELAAISGPQVCGTKIEACHHMHVM